MVLLALLLAAAALSPQPVSAHHPVSTASATAQSLFDRGLTLFYAYNGSEGVHVFAQAAQADPHLAMAYWGQALSYGRDINVPLDEPRFNKAHAAIEKAAALEDRATPAERAYIDAMRLRYAGSWADAARDETAYRNAMAAAVAANPGDDDLAALYVEALLENSNQNLWKTGTSIPATNDTAVMVNTLDRIIARNPQHIMANHLIVHVFEPSTDRSRAVLAADRLDAMTFAPEDEHLAHMTAHTWVDTGAYAKAEAASTRALALFDTYLKTPGIDPKHEGYYGHDATIGWGASLMLGNYAKALTFANRLDTFRKAHGRSANAALLTAARFGRVPPGGALAATSPTDDAHLVSAYVALARGDVAGARSELAGWNSTTHDSFALALLGAVALRAGDRATADARFASAWQYESEQYQGELLPVFPAGEIQGDAYFQSGDFAAAAATYEKTATRYPNDARALFGLSQSLAKLGKTGEAASARRAFEALWKDSDTAPGMRGR